MFKRTFGAFLLLSCGLTAHAATQTFDFRYSSPEWSLAHTGSFSGDDVNADGIFSKDEVATFRFGGINFLPGAQPSSGTRSLDSFSYQPGNTLAFRANWSYSGSHYGFFNFPGNRLEYAYYEADFWCDGPRCYWPTNYEYGSDNVTFSITNTTPVPEPESWLMLGAGLAVVGATRRKLSRKRSAFGR